MAINVRRATPNDLDAINALQTQLRHHELQFDPLLNSGKSFEKEKRSYANHLAEKDTFFFIAEDGSVPVGYMCGTIEPAGEHLKIEKRGNVDDGYVVTEYRKRGIAQQLMKQILEAFKAEGVRFVTLQVYEGNIGSIRAWQKMGFKPYMIEMSKTIE